MRIQDWECTINHDGTVRAAKHAENGVAVWSPNGLMAQGGIPAEVLEWLIRPMLRKTWEDGLEQGMPRQCDFDLNPYAGEPPHKDDEPS